MSDRLQEIRARLDAATPGPWSNSVSWDCVEADVMPTTNYLEPYRTTVARARLPMNADLIAHAPADIAWLLDEISMLEMDVAEISRKAEDAEDFWKQRAEHLEKYAVHKHNDCWQSGECECGLNNE
jgi:hypothetical protein